MLTDCLSVQHSRLDTPVAGMIPVRRLERAEMNGPLPRRHEYCGDGKKACNRKIAGPIP